MYNDFKKVCAAKRLRILFLLARFTWNSQKIAKNLSFCELTKKRQKTCSLGALWPINHWCVCQACSEPLLLPRRRGAGGSRGKCSERGSAQWFPSSQHSRAGVSKHSLFRVSPGPSGREAARPAALQPPALASFAALEKTHPLRSPFHTGKETC